MHIILVIEIVFIALIFLSLLSILLPWTPAPVTLILLGLATLLLVAHLVVFPFRWQIIPAALVILFLLMGLFFSWEPGRALSIAGYGMGTLSLLLSLALFVGLPVRKLPVPEGPHKVGVTSVVRSYTPSSIPNEPQSPERGLFLKIWYPANVGLHETFKPEKLWGEFSNPRYFSLLERVFTNYLSSMTTNSLRNAPLAPGVGPVQIIVYNHALLSIASENTLLMEALASHGYIVISVQHEGQRSEYSALRNDMTPDEVAAEAADLKALGTATDMSREERSALALKVYSENITLPEIVKRRAMDSSYVLDHLTQILSAIPGDVSHVTFDLNRVAFVGLSLGGAVATELCKTDKRCAVVVNLDGGVFGTDIGTPTKAPYLMLYSERNEGGNDFLNTASANTFEDDTIVGADHLNFHDATIVLPGLKWLGLLGKIDGDRMIEERNRRVTDYLSRVY